VLNRFDNFSKVVKSHPDGITTESNTTLTDNLLNFTG